MIEKKLRLVMLTKPFAPMVGGLETAALLLSRELSALGHAVTVVTLAKSEFPESESFEVLRKPTALHLMRTILSADGVITQGLVLGLAWPLLFVPRPTLTIHQGMYPSQGRATWLRRLLARRVNHIAISKPVADSIPLPSTIIGNPFEASLFKNFNQPRPKGSLLFVGRLVPEKGPADAIEALSRLVSVDPKSPYVLTIAGEGPLESELRNQADALGVQDRIRWAGKVTGHSLARLYNQNQIALVPSRWPEPLGIVALEAAACGCFVIGTEQGGLPEAIGPCGQCVPNNDALALSQAIRDAISNPTDDTARNAIKTTHLNKFHPRSIAEAVLSILRGMIQVP